MTQAFETNPITFAYRPTYPSLPVQFGLRTVSPEGDFYQELNSRCSGNNTTTHNCTFSFSQHSWVTRSRMFLPGAINWLASAKSFRISLYYNWGDWRRFPPSWVLVLIVEIVTLITESWKTWRLVYLNFLPWKYYKRGKLYILSKMKRSFEFYFFEQLY